MVETYVHTYAYDLSTIQRKGDKEKSKKHKNNFTKIPATTEQVKQNTRQKTKKMLPQNETTIDKKQLI